MRRQRFRHRLLSQLRRVPWWITSALVHLGVIFILAKIHLFHPTPEGPLAIHAGLIDDLDEEYALEKGNDILKDPNPVLDPVVLEEAIRFDRLEQIADRDLELPRGKVPERRVIAVGGSFGWRSEGGRQVAVLINESLESGWHQQSWRADGIGSGIYLARLEAGGRILARKLALLK